MGKLKEGGRKQEQGQEEWGRWSKGLYRFRLQFHN